MHQIRKVKLSGVESISINLTSEYMSIELEFQLFRIFPSCLHSIIERSLYNRRNNRNINNLKTVSA